jgi:hypothetical protein
MYAGTMLLGCLACSTRPSPANDVVQVQRHARDAAIGAVPAVLLQHVFPHLAASERAALVLDAGDLRVLHQLHVEANTLDGNAGERGEAAQLFDPGHAGVDAVLQARGQPPLRPPPVVEPWLPITQIAVPAPAPEASARCQDLADLPAPVRKLGQE